MRKNKYKSTNKDTSNDKATFSATDFALAIEVAAYGYAVTVPTYLYIAETVGMGAVFGAPAAIFVTAPFLLNLDKLSSINQVLADTHDYLMYGTQE